jgi:7-cyano-7-deazaguanine synthase
MFNNVNKCVVVLSGGLDSTILTHSLVDELGKDNVVALSYNYGQKQSHELTLASKTCKSLGIEHKLIDISFLGDIVGKVSANIKGSDIDMPTIQDVIGDPQPPTYVPYRNMILNSIAFSFAESNGCDTIATGLQIHDEYGYWDTSKQFVDSMNQVSSCNRTHQIKMIAPFAELTKHDELELLKVIYNDISVAKDTITCYNPNVKNESCGTCPSCSERISAFGMLGEPDPIEYSIDLDWDKICVQFSEVVT